MKPYAKIHNNGAAVIVEKTGAMYCVTLRTPCGNVHDKMRCDDYHAHLAYRRAFNKIARNM